MIETVIPILEEAAKRHRGNPALHSKSAGKWTSTSWEGYRDEVFRVARALIAIGTRPGDGVAILGYNCREWFVSYLGAIAAGAIPAGLYTTSSPGQCEYIVSHCGASVAFVEDEQQLSKFLEIRERLPKLLAIVLFRGNSTAQGVLTWDAFISGADGIPESDVQTRIAAQSPSDLCTLIYTSGTTGPPKAVMITHRNLVWTARVSRDVLGLGASDRMISYLPLSHIAEQLLSLHIPLHSGSAVYFAQSMENLGEHLGEVRPTVFLGVPRVWEKIESKMRAAGAQTKGLKRKIATWAKRVGARAGEALQRGDSMPFGYGLADRVVFSKVRDRLGLDQARYCLTSAAPISRSTLEYFLSLGIPIYEIYGMSECTGPTTFSVPGTYRLGSVGKPAPGAEIQISDDGEILIRGPHVFPGYYKESEATRTTLDGEGWLHSGDVGAIDGEGFLTITDRKKDILITSGGQNVSPQNIERQLKSIPGIAQAVIVGDRKSFLVALMTLDPDAVVALSPAAAGMDLAGASRSPAVREAIQSHLDRINASLAQVETVKRFTILSGGFSIDGGEMTPTMKTRRKIVLEKYAREIAALYEDP